MKISVAQLGARRHYAIPRLLAERGLLGQFYTDISAANWPLSAVRQLPNWLTPKPIKRLSDRSPDGVPKGQIVSFPSFGISYARRPQNMSRSRHWIEGGKRFCQLILNRGLGDIAGIYTFTGAGLELLQNARQKGIAGIHDQIMASRRTEHLLLTRQRMRFPTWEKEAGEEEGLQEYCQREAAEWDAASLVLCGSPFVRDSVVEGGGDPARCVILPYGANPTFAAPPKPDRAARRPLRVLFVGEVGLRKGAPDVLAVSEALSTQVELRLVGKISCPAGVIASAPANVKFVGVSPRSEMPNHYGWADVFLLPSICEGSAGAVFEALASSVPVICTPNSGSIVEDGVTGFIVAAEDQEAIIASLLKLDRDREQLNYMRQNAFEAANTWSLQNYGDRLAAVLTQNVNAAVAT